MTIANMKYTTVEQVNEMREAAIEVEREREDHEQARTALEEALGQVQSERDEWKAQAEAEAQVCSMYRDERDALEKRLHNGRDKYNAMVEQCQELDIRASQLSAKLRESEQREHALAAHVERLNSVIFDTLTAVEHGSLEDVPYESAAAVRFDSPEISLARRDARMKAEALEKVEEETKRKAEADTMRAHIRNQAKRLRRQAEKAKCPICGDFGSACSDCGRQAEGGE